MGIPAAAENPQFQSGAGSGPSPGFALQAKHCNAYFCLQENSKADSFSHPHSPQKSQKTGHVRKGKVPSHRTFSPNCKTATIQTGFKASFRLQTHEPQGQGPLPDRRWGLVMGHGSGRWGLARGDGAQLGDWRASSPALRCSALRQLASHCKVCLDRPSTHARHVQDMDTHARV